MKQWNEQQRAAIRRQSKEQLAKDYETFAIQSTTFMRQRDELLAALQAAHSRLDQKFGHADAPFDVDMLELLSFMEDAIAKATGEDTK